MNEDTHTQGFVISVGVSDERVCLKLFRFIPLCSISVSEIHFMRISSSREYLSTPFHVRSYWPTPIHGFSGKISHLYMIETKRRRVFLRLKSSLHYKLRTAIGRNALDANRQSLRRRIEAGEDARMASGGEV